MPKQNNDINATLNRLKSMLVRRRWWVLVTTCVVSIGVIRASYLLPNHYRSEAVIFMANPSVSGQYVTPNNITNEMEAIDTITREILSRERLQQIIDEFGLYPHQRQIGNIALTALMHSDIEVLPLSKNPERRPMNAFLIAFTATDPWTAQKVTSRLTSLYIEKSQQTEQQVDTGTTTFLEQQLESAQADLDRRTALLQSFKMKNLGQLPEQQGDNLQVLSGLQFHLQATQTDLARARQQHTYLLAMLLQYAPASEAQGYNAAVPVPGSQAALQDDLARLRRERNELLARYSPLYPDAVAVNQQIADEEAQLKKAASSPRPAAVSKAETSEAATASLSLDPAAIQLRSQLQANEMEIEDGQKQAGQLTAQIATYQQRLALTPVREQQMEELQRTYDLSKQHYADLLNKKTQSELATRLAAQQSNEQFRVIDPASLPLKPAGPQRQKIALGGLAGALVLGLALGFLIEARDCSFHVENEARAYFPVPLVIGIPPLLTDGEKRRRVRRMRLGWAMGCLMLVLLAAAQFYAFRNG